MCNHHHFPSLGAFYWAFFNAQHLQFKPYYKTEDTVTLITLKLTKLISIISRILA